ncbi:hypothetical protein H696_03914 [Fonticula alba]|uniref:Uncharacterized protein n=1 Tax=Fonticula alba TaxID=691883 RepID=A0A058Z5Y0_FONAL|nr:hypothetical protein H696_03914 [Fonticula alba]KCV69491.1 hypothetical protein H696_03914 [Fonticula alba]|eukprot:XP_009496056.1 hypothetical protein H696_03914 [Fonticula alba]
MSADVGHHTARREAKQERHFIILDIGAGLVKAGLAGEFAPRLILPTEEALNQPRELARILPARPRYGRPASTAGDQTPPARLSFEDLLAGAAQAGAADPGPYRRARAALRGLVETLLRRMALEPREYLFALLDSPWTTLGFKRLAADVLLLDMKASFLVFVPAPLAAAIAANRTTALVVDAGHRAATCSLLMDGFLPAAEPELNVHSPMAGGPGLRTALEFTLARRGQLVSAATGQELPADSWQAIRLADSFLDGMVFSLRGAGTGAGAGAGAATPPPAAEPRGLAFLLHPGDFKLDGEGPAVEALAAASAAPGGLLVRAPARVLPEAVLLTLLGPGAGGAPASEGALPLGGLAGDVAGLLLRAPIDYRAPLASRIVLTGGMLACLPAQVVASAVSVELRRAGADALSRHVAVVDTLAPPATVAWRGASLAYSHVSSWPGAATSAAAAAVMAVAVAAAEPRDLVRGFFCLSQATWVRAAGPLAEARREWAAALALDPADDAEVNECRRVFRQALSASQALIPDWTSSRGKPLATGAGGHGHLARRGGGAGARRPGAASAAVHAALLQ